MSWRKTAITPLLTHWSYCSLTLSHRFAALSYMVLHPRLLFVEVHIKVRGRGPQSSLQVPMFDAVKRKSVQIRPELVCKHLPGLRDSPQIAGTKQADKIVPFATASFVVGLPNLKARLEVLQIGVTWRQGITESQVSGERDYLHYIDQMI